MFINILGFKIYKNTKTELIELLNSYPKVNIISGNPEVLFNGLNNKTLGDNFRKDSSVIIPDGVGTVLASKIQGTPVKEKIPGIEVMGEIIKKAEREGKGIYLLGAKEEVLLKCSENLLIKYPQLNIVGMKNGYFKKEDSDSIAEDIKSKNPYAIFIAMGSPRQEEFISKYMDELPCKIFMGVGGSFDVFAGNVNRAPKWMISLGLEWLYRVSKEPWRIKRLGAIPKFLLLVLKNKIKRGNHE
ncbi:WecB/TagA/CpsF family glycosyltransferase [Clostridium intestinale]|uniref:WecB/TagA/CpsF family glycosyltransferase n=1 Tax=Clostridium intestinale TaxID=36845 RepID=UPI002DD6B5DF|nr:WecB/TagA/CpsF family glycosyltransferase [Clostridium intestinale]WRY53433.1 WecB/TagA/CpsF family glycosyltransferase [Clostridium intestinale]